MYARHRLRTVLGTAPLYKNKLSMNDLQSVALSLHRQGLLSLSTAQKGSPSLETGDLLGYYM
jgi:hypothetical protein